MGAWWLLICAAIGAVSIEGALHPGRNVLTAAQRGLALNVAQRNQATLQEAVITAGDGVTLRAWSMRPAAANGDAVLLLHGQADNRAGMLGHADLLLRHGYAVLLPDARAHGESGGGLATYGVLEADDLRRWMEWIDKADHPDCIFGLGDSMGGAQLLNSLAATSDYCAVVAESAFSDFRSAAYDRLGQELHTGRWAGETILRPAVEFAFMYARWRYGVDLERASPVRAVAKSSVPVLLVHGLADDNLPPWHSERMKAANPRVELWEPPGAGHCSAYGSAPDEYEQRVTGWFAAHSRQSVDLRARR